jgi:predicted NBD/HSP70 family sugar kinase
MKRATVRDLRRVNRAAVLRPLFLDGPLNRVVLAQRTGLSSASVTNVVTDLLGEGLVREEGSEESDGGRPRKLLRINPDFGVAIGVDVGETGILVEGFDLALNELGGRTLAVDPRRHSAEEIVAEVSQAVVELCREFDRGQRRVLGVGVAVPGVVEHGAETLVHAPGIGWRDVALARMLQREIVLPLFVENGAKTLGQAEMWFGAGRGVSHAVIALWGTGVGAAVFVDGSLYRGAASSAGEWGHTNVVIGGERCRCGAAGCLEAYVGAERLLRQWASAHNSVQLPADLDQSAWLDRLLLAASEPGAARSLLEATARYFGTATANLVNLFAPERIIIGGWAGLRLGPELLPRIRQVVAEQALDYPAARVSVELGQVGPDAVALGACTLVIEPLLAAGGQPPEARAASARASAPA